MLNLIIIQCISVSFAVYISRARTLRHIYIATFLNSLVNMIMYFVNHDPSTAAACAVVAVRGLVYIFRDRIRIPHPVIPAAFIVIHLTLGFAAIENPWQLLTIAAPCATCLYLWYCRKLQHIRLGNFGTHILWLVYDLHSSLLIVSAADAAIMLANGIAYIQNRTELAVVYNEGACHG